MCFITDEYDWTAQVYEKSSGPAETAMKCEECFAVIQPGEMLHHIYMRQYDSCNRCEFRECDCADGKCCQCEEPEFGEEYDYCCCNQCERFLQAVEAAELEEGCDSTESRPMLGQMTEAIGEMRAAEAKRYWKKAVAMHPDMRQWLAKLWHRLFAQ